MTEVYRLRAALPIETYADATEARRARAASVRGSRVTACRIVRELKNTDHALDRARAECAKFGSEWLGDERGGRYVLRTPLGTVEGTYTVEGKTIEFLVGKKPRVVPCKLIERILDQFLRDG